MYSCMVRIAVPLVFVTVQSCEVCKVVLTYVHTHTLSGETSPFSELWPTIFDTSKNEKAYRRVQVFVNVTRTVTFIAQVNHSTC